MRALTAHHPSEARTACQVNPLPFEDASDSFRRPRGVRCGRSGHTRYWQTLASRPALFLQVLSKVTPFCPSESILAVIPVSRPMVLLRHHAFADWITAPAFDRFTQ